VDKFLADSLAQLGGRIDALVNNAGIANVPESVQTSNGC
jgi:NAD(P)-dependent dehydrogenase (short-subunit alcohol dehydrogenase family)